SVPRVGEAAALALAVCSLLLGLVDWEPYLSVPRAALSNPLGLKTVSAALWTIVGGALLAILLGRWGHRLARVGNSLLGTLGSAPRLALGLGGAVESIDSLLRQWPAAGMSLLMLGLLLGAAMLAGR